MLRNPFIGRPASSAGRRPAHRLGARRAAWFALAALIGLAAAGALYHLIDIPDLAALQTEAPPDLDVASIAYTADGQELARYYRTHRVWVGYGQISPAVFDALVATEDHRFFEHRGVDPVRLAGSVWYTLRGSRQGGSTLTMQLARNLYPDVGREVTLARKLREIVVACKLERRYGKHEILEMYLNTVPFGQNAFGIEAAARTYFDKPARALTVPEAATLVALLRGPSRYNPLRHPERARQRRNLVLRQMVEHDRLSADAYRRLAPEPLHLNLRPARPASDLAPHFAAYVRRWMEDWAEAHGYDLYTDGLRIYTTLDTRLQQHARAAVEAHLPGLQAVAAVEWSAPHPPEPGSTYAPYEARLGRVSPFAHFWATHPHLLVALVRRSERYRRAVRQGEPPDRAQARLLADAAFLDSLRTAHARLETGLVAIDPHTGHVKAWIGGRDFAADQYDKVALARRQPGSTFKPFVYAAAVEHGFAPDDSLQDARMTFTIAAEDDATWTPRNAGGYSGAYVRLRDGLAWSKNTITAQLIAALGPEHVADVAHRMGIRSPLARVPSLALGSSEVTLLELTSAYGTFVSGGVHHPAVVVTHIDDAAGRRLATFVPEGHRALTRQTAYTVLDMMRDVVQRGTGRALRTRFGIEADVAGKTGTSQGYADGWFILAHPRLVVGAWVGFNDRRLTFRTSDWGQGARTALPVVGEFVRRVLDDPEAALGRGVRFAPPPGYRPPRPAVTSLEAFHAPAGLERPAPPGPLPLRDALAEGLARPDDTPPPEADPEAALRRALGPPPKKDGS